MYTVIIHWITGRASNDPATYTILEMLAKRKEHEQVLFELESGIEAAGGESVACRSWIATNNEWVGIETMQEIKIQVASLETAWLIFSTVNHLLEICGNYSGNIRLGDSFHKAEDLLSQAAKYEKILRQVFREIKRKDYSAAAIRRTLKQALEH